MPVKGIHSSSGHHFKFGRKRPTEPAAKLRLADYMPAAPAPVPDCNYAAAAMEALSQVYLNDSLGDCVIACAGHLFGVLRENAEGNRSIFSEGEIINQYSKLCGFVPGDASTDNGCVISEVIAGITRNGMKGHRKANGEKIKVSHRIAGSLLVDGRNKTEVRQAIYWFENVIIGLDLPDEWLNNFTGASGFTWDVAGPPDPNNGHCIIGCSTTPEGVGIGTWGLTGIMTYAAISEYATRQNGGELYTILSEESINRAKQLTPNGLDWAALEADFKSMGGLLSA